ISLLLLSADRLPTTAAEAGLPDRCGDVMGDVGVEYAGHDVVRVEFVVTNHISESTRGGEQHRDQDLVALRVQQASEDAGESKHIVDLVREVAATGGDDGRVGGGRLRIDLGNRVGQREHDSVRPHGGDVVGGKDVGSRHADENVCANKCGAKVTPDRRCVRVLRDPLK